MAIWGGVVAFGTVKFYKSHEGWGAISSPALLPGLDALITFGNIAGQSGATGNSLLATEWSSSMCRRSRTVSSSSRHGRGVSLTPTTLIDGSPAVVISPLVVPRRLGTPAPNRFPPLTTAR